MSSWTFSIKRAVLLRFKSCRAISTLCPRSLVHNNVRDYVVSRYTKMDKTYCTYSIKQAMHSLNWLEKGSATNLKADLDAL